MTTKNDEEKQTPVDKMRSSLGWKILWYVSKVEEGRWWSEKKTSWKRDNQKVLEAIETIRRFVEKNHFLDDNFGSLGGNKALAYLDKKINDDLTVSSAYQKRGAGNKATDSGVALLIYCALEEAQGDRPIIDGIGDLIRENGQLQSCLKQIEALSFKSELVQSMGKNWPNDIVEEIVTLHPQSENDLSHFFVLPGVLKRIKLPSVTSEESERWERSPKPGLRKGGIFHYESVLKREPKSGFEEFIKSGLENVFQEMMLPENRPKINVADIVERLLKEGEKDYRPLFEEREINSAYPKEPPRRKTKK